jgi:hypothetical protein
MHYRYRETVYHITILQLPAGSGEMRVTEDGIELHDKIISLVDDHREHWVDVKISATVTALESSTPT